MINSRPYLLIFCLLLLVVNVQTALSQEIILRKGAVTDSIPVNDTLAESFAVYLPREFSGERSWPVIFVFDPEGRGSRVAQLFRVAAEEQGYIIAATNNLSGENTLEDQLEVVSRFMDRVLTGFPADRERLYVAGLGKGAQTAAYAGFAIDQISGIFTVGDLWLMPGLLKKKDPRVFVALSGYSDHNLYIMEKAVRMMKRAGYPALLYKTEITEEWPESVMISHAVGSFSLEAIAAGKDSTASDLVGQLYMEEQETLERLRRSMQHYRAYEMLEQMEGKYAGFGKKGELREQKRALRRERTFKKQRREFRAAAIRETELKPELEYFFEEDLMTLNFENLGWWAGQVKELEEYKDRNSPAWTEMAERVKGYFAALSRDTHKKLKLSKAGVDPLIFTAILETIFASREPAGYMKIISLSARDGDYYTALLYLEDLLKTGYDDMESLYSIPGTLDLRLSPEFNELIKEYLGESRYHDKPVSDPETLKN